MQLELSVNDKHRALEVEPYELLADVLRERMGLTGTHIGCDTAQCGACTVLVDGQAIKSCNVLALQVQGQSVYTIEGCESRAQWQAVQSHFSQCHALQCGFCTPGMIMRTIAMAQEDLCVSAHVSKADVSQLIADALEGNLCRCTGYYPIVEAVQMSLHSLLETQPKIASSL